MGNKQMLWQGAVAGAGAGVGFLLTKWIVAQDPISLFIGTVIGAFVFGFVGGWTDD